VPVVLVLAGGLASAASAASPTAADLDGLQFEQTSTQIDNDASVGVCTGSYRWINQNDKVTAYQSSVTGWSATSDPAPASRPPSGSVGMTPQMLFIAGYQDTFSGIDSFAGVRYANGELWSIHISAPGPDGRCVNPRALAIGESYRADATWSIATPGAADASGPATVYVQRQGRVEYVETVAIGTGPAPALRPKIPAPAIAPSASPPAPLPAGPVVACPPIGTIFDGVVLRKTDVTPKLSFKPFAIGYGNLALQFSVQPAVGGSLCRVRSNEGHLPVNIIVATPLGRKHLHVADSVSTATLDFVTVDASPGSTCDFSYYAALRRGLLFATTFVPDTAHDCFLNTRTPGDLAVRWSIPGFAEFAVLPGGKRQFIASTPPLTYYVDVRELIGRSSLVLTTNAIQQIESYIHATLIANLPMVDDMAIIQDPPAHVRVVGPNGREAGHGVHVSGIPGASYHEFEDRSLLWIPRPAIGGYAVTLTGHPKERYSLAFTYVRMLGARHDQAATETHKGGRLPPSGERSAFFTLDPARTRSRIRETNRCIVPAIGRETADRARAALAATRCHFGGAVRGAHLRRAAYRPRARVNGYARRIAAPASSTQHRLVRVRGGRQLPRGTVLYLVAR
jgi:hypothetical protein